MTNMRYVFESSLLGSFWTSLSQISFTSLRIAVTKFHKHGVSFPVYFKETLLSQLGMLLVGNMDEFSEKLQTAFDPPPLPPLVSESVVTLFYGNA